MTVLAGGHTAWGGSGHDHQPAAKTLSHNSADDGAPYLLPQDPVSGQALAQVQKPIVMNHNGREIRFASKASAQKFQANPTHYLASIDKKMIQMQKKLYPLKTCVVSGGKLGGNVGEPIDYIYKNRLIRFCCEGCVDSFVKSPAGSLAKLNEAAIADQKDTYPLKTCLVSGGSLGSMGDPIDRVYAGRLVRFCCKGCIKKFTTHPQKYLAKLANPSHAGHKH